MRIKRPAPALVNLFATLLPGTGGEGRTMFGCPCGFLGGNMFMGLFEDNLFLRLAAADRALLLREDGAEPFDPMGGRPMREYVVVPRGWLEGDADDELRAWIAKAASYARTLPPKAKRSPGKRPSAGRPSPAPRKPGKR